MKIKNFKWDEEKNELLKKERGISFEEILNSTFLGVGKHQTRKNQIVLLFEHEKYVWVVPCVVEEKYYFLKTMFPSRKYKRCLKAKKVQNEKSKIIKRRKRN